jgi:hypothetical protein
MPNFTMLTLKNWPRVRTCVPSILGVKFVSLSKPRKLTFRRSAVSQASLVKEKRGTASPAFDVPTAVPARRSTSQMNQINYYSLRESDRGRWVQYQPSKKSIRHHKNWPPFFAGQCRLGRILKWRRTKVYVVFACPDWDHYQDYMACPVNPKFLSFLENV